MNERERARRRTLLLQKLIGLGLLLMSGAVLLLCSHGATMEDRDGTAALLLAPLGLYLLLTRRIVIR